MPEGDTIHKTRAVLGPILEGNAIRAAECRWPRMVAGLVGTTVTSVRAVGKHLLIAFDDDTLLRVHLGMKGSWHRYDRGERWLESREGLGVMLATDEEEVVCFYPPEVERFRAKELATHPVLSKLGPDLTASPVDFDEVMRRVRAIDDTTELADALLNQRVASGIGNVYKSEVCFIFRLSPFTPLHAIDDVKLRAIYEKASELLQENVLLGPRITTTGRTRQRLYVYGAMHRPCMVCGGPVRYTRQGVDDRITWWCPRCQPAPAP